MSTSDDQPIFVNDDSKQPLELTHGNTARDRARGRGARRIFHSTLAAELNDRGAATVDELYLRFDCFLLPFSHKEIRQVLESARREGLVAEVADQRDGYGAAVEEQWTTTEKGRKLRRPRALALPDLGYLLFSESDRAAKLFDVGKTIVTMAVPVLALVGIDRLEANDAARWAAFVGVGVILAWAVLYGLRAELDLRAAADSWLRLKRDRPERWRYQKSWSRSAYLPALLATLYIAAGLGLGFGFPAVWWYATSAAAIAFAILYLALVLPLYRAWHKRDPDRCREEWVRRGNEAAASGRAPQAYRMSPAPAGSDGAEAAQGEAAEQAIGGGQDREVG